MKFTINSSEFSKSLERAAKFISTKPLMPILNSIQIVTGESGIFITAFNLAHGIEIDCEAEIIEAGSICIPLSAVGIIKLMPGQLIIHSDENDLVTISNLPGNAQIQGQSSDEYPELIDEDTDLGTSIEFDASAFSRILKTCGQSTSNDETKVILTGINIAASNGFLTAIATDGHRLTVFNTSVDASIEIAPITIPSKSLNLIDSDKSDKVTFATANGQVSIGTSNSRSIMRVLEGKYPDALLLLPKSFTRKLEIDRRKLIESLNVMNAISDANNLVEFHIFAKYLKIYSKSDGKTGEQEISCMFDDPLALESEEFQIAFNLKYLLDGLKMFDSDRVTLSINEALQPVVVKPANSDIDLIYLLMPVQIRS